MINVIPLPDNMRLNKPICYLDNVSGTFWTHFRALNITYVLLYLLLYSMYFEYALYEYVYNNR